VDQVNVNGTCQCIQPNNVVVGGICQCVAGYENWKVIYYQHSVQTGPTPQDYIQIDYPQPSQLPTIANPINTRLSWTWGVGNGGVHYIYRITSGASLILTESQPGTGVLTHQGIANNQYNVIRTVLQAFNGVPVALSPLYYSEETPGICHPINCPINQVRNINGSCVPFACPSGQKNLALTHSEPFIGSTISYTAQTTELLLHIYHASIGNDLDYVLRINGVIYTTSISVLYFIVYPIPVQIGDVLTIEQRGTVPSAFLALNIFDNNGTNCQSEALTCPSSSINTGTAYGTLYYGTGPMCQRCPNGEVPVDNVCTPCAINAISVNGVCQQCPAYHINNGNNVCTLDCTAVPYNTIMPVISGNAYFTPSASLICIRHDCINEYILVARDQTFDDRTEGFLPPVFSKTIAHPTSLYVFNTGTSTVCTVELYP
jgi:hypothetical protein